MKQVIFIAVLLFCMNLSAPPGNDTPVILLNQPINNYEAIWKAVCQVESNGNAYAVNYEKGGFSCGIAQIRQIRIEHYNRISGKNYVLDDAFNPEISKEIFMFYAHRIGNEDKLIRAWNGSGKETYHYLNKVKERL